MLLKLKDTIYKLTAVTGIELVLLQDGLYACNVVVLKADKKNIVLEKQFRLEQCSLSDLAKQLDKTIPVSIVVNGRGILHKKVDATGEDTKVLLQQVLPNARPQDFFVQRVSSETGNLVSIVRKEVLQPIIDAFAKEGVSCIHLSLGGVLVGAMAGLIKEFSASSVLQWSTNSLNLGLDGIPVEYKIVEEQLPEKKFTLESDRIEGAYLTPYAAAFIPLLALPTSIHSFVDEVEASKAEYLNGLLFKKASWAVLLLFLVVLLVNFLLFSKYSSENSILVQKEVHYRGMISEMETLSKEVEEKQDFLATAGWLKSSSSSLFADRIALTVPVSVRLTEMSLNSLDERKSKDEKKEVFTTGKIILKGECSKPTELNEWLDKIKSIDHIDKARLVHYAFDNKESRGVFSIEIETER